MAGRFKWSTTFWMWRSHRHRWEKQPGKDQAQNKATYPALFGIEKSRAFARELAARAARELDCYGERATRLHAIAEYLIVRRT